jgi:hypothetical protein
VIHQIRKRLLFLSVKDYKSVSCPTLIRTHQYYIRSFHLICIGYNEDDSTASLELIIKREFRLQETATSFFYYVHISSIFFHTNRVQGQSNILELIFAINWLTLYRKYIKRNFDPKTKLLWQIKNLVSVNKLLEVQQML